MESVKTITELFKSETEKNNYIAQIENLNNFCISRNIKTRFLIPVENIVLEGVQNKKSFNLNMIHILEIKD